MGNAYDPKRVERKIVRRWIFSDAFRPSVRRSKGKKKFSVVIPPPNVTGSLHMGHALNASMQDVLVRYHRMKGDDTVWVPGTDHAGIATQNVVERELRKEGITRHDLGRARFEKRVWKWKKQYGRKIHQQLMMIGASCDWSRERFTMDDEYVRAVQDAFIHYAKKGFIYRGDRLVNWCPRCASSISDLEVKHEKRDGILWYIRYSILGSKKTISVATVRPETMLGDTGVAVYPEDRKYRGFVGKKAILPLVGREIPIVADKDVDTSIGTGAVKMTPAHDPADWEIGERHKLPVINVIGEDGHMTSEAGEEYVGLNVEDARKKILADLQALGVLEKEERIQHNVGVCDRCGTDIQPLVSRQWFMRMAPLAEQAMNVVRKNEITFVPSRWKRAYLRWLENVRDWCVSRQLWWGHRIPAWYCATDDSHIEFSVSRPKKCTLCGGNTFTQDPDVLDTWFSSALWPFAVFGWPKKTSDLSRFYPTDVLMTGSDILTLWVVRMVFSGLEFMKEIPFKQVVINPTVLNIKGQRMSKSLGTGIDPMDLIDKYGADATRYGLLVQAQRDQQALRFDEEAVRAGRNFVNKLWNMGQFLQNSGKSMKVTTQKQPTLLDRWALYRCAIAARDIEKALNEYRFSDAARALQVLIWDDIADWYIEAGKVDGMITLPAAHEVYRTILILAHPFLPFVTEELWGIIGEKGILAQTPWAQLSLKKAPKTIELFQDVVRDIRSARVILGMSASVRPSLRVDTRGKLSELFGAITHLAHLDHVEYGSVSHDWIAIPSRTGISIAFPRDVLSQLELSEQVVLFEKKIEKAKDDVEKITVRVNKMRGRAPEDVLKDQCAKRDDIQKLVQEYQAALTTINKIAKSV